MLKPSAFISLIILVIATLSGGAQAEPSEPICVPPMSGDPTPQVKQSSRDLKCAGADDFTRSCAYQNFIKGEKLAELRDLKKTESDRIMSVLDPSVSTEGMDPNTRFLHEAFADSRFVNMYHFWNTTPSPHPDRKTALKGDGMVGASLKKDDPKFTPKDVAWFFDVLEKIPKFDKSGAFISTVNLLDALPDGSGWSASPEEKKKIFEKIYDKKIEFQSKHSAGCSSVYVTTVKRSNYPVEVSVGKPREGKKPEPSKDEKSEAILASQAKSESDRTLSGLAENLRGCGNANVQSRTTTGVLEHGCAVDLPIQIFSDNEPKLTPENEKVMLDAINNNSCYKNAITQKLKIKKIAIATSANTLHNTKNYCKWSFDTLSSDRAKSIHSSLSSVFAEAKPTFIVDAGGSNGDGSSGPCAYVAKEEKKSSGSAFEVERNGKILYFSEIRNPEYSGNPGEKKLEPFKYAKATIYFEDRSNEIKEAIPRWSALTSCTSVEFGCR